MVLDLTTVKPSECTSIEVNSKQTQWIQGTFWQCSPVLDHAASSNGVWTHMCTLLSHHTVSTNAA